ncbi:MAG: Glu-tRNA(Gln) amidotransferase subunit GatE [Candidatus Aenigmatarchaeota archaeon]
MNWQELGLKVGLEVHWELATKTKLFCNCPNKLVNREPDKIIERYLRPSFGELGDVDVAAKAEAMKSKKIIYQFYNDVNCLVEIDEEPPHQPNSEALEISFVIAELLNARIVDEIHVMRKTIIDGSNVSGFQRTMLIGLNGYIETSFGKVGIASISLEEDSARIIDNSKSIFRLDRLGMPEVEISTKPDIHTPDQALEAAEQLGKLLKSTGKVKLGLGVVRQDVNVSIKNGLRTEIKHVQRLSQIPDVVIKEVQRQLETLKKGENLENSVRVALEDCSTKFLRPLSGAARMYVETDVYPILVDKSLLEKIRKSLPESLDKKLERYLTEYKLSQEIASQLVNERWQIFERAVSLGVDKSIAASTLTNILKDLGRKGVDVDSLDDQDIINVLLAYKCGKIAKEAIPLLIENIFKEKDVDKLIDILKLRSISIYELEKIVDEKIKQNIDKLKAGNAEKILMGLVMAEVRGRIDGSIVNEVVKEKIKSNITS